MFEDYGSTQDEPEGITMLPLEDIATATIVEINDMDELDDDCINGEIVYRGNNFFFTFDENEDDRDKYDAYIYIDNTNFEDLFRDDF